MKQIELICGMIGIVIKGLFQPTFPIWTDQFRETFDISEFPKYKKNYLAKK